MGSSMDYVVRLPQQTKQTCKVAVPQTVFLCAQGFQTVCSFRFWNISTYVIRAHLVVRPKLVPAVFPYVCTLYMYTDSFMYYILQDFTCLHPILCVEFAIFIIGVQFLMF